MLSRLWGKRQSGVESDLFAPTLGGLDGTAEFRPRPWRLGSQLYVGFFGGILAVTFIAGANAERLGLPRARVAAIGALGVVGLILSIVGSIVLDIDRGHAARLVTRASGVVGFLAFYAIQRGPDRAYQLYRSRGEEGYASLWGPGLLAVVVFGLLQSLLTYAVVGES